MLILVDFKSLKRMDNSKQALFKLLFEQIQHQAKALLLVQNQAEKNFFRVP